MRISLLSSLVLLLLALTSSTLLAQTEGEKEKRADPGVDEKVNLLLERMIDQIDHHNEFMAALKSLVNLGSDAVPALITSLDSRTLRKRDYAAYALGLIKDPRAVKPLLQLLLACTKDTAYHRIGHSILGSSISALGKIGSPSVEALLEALAESGEQKAGYHIAMALAAVGKPAADHLAVVMHHRRDDIGFNCALALAEMGDTRALNPLITRLNQIRLPYLKDKEHLELTSQIQLCLQGLGNIGDRRAVPVILRQWAKYKSATFPEEMLRIHIIAALTKFYDARALDALVEAMKCKRITIRRDATEALGNIRSNAALPILSMALKDKDVVVRSTAIQAIGKLQSKEAIPALVQAMSSPEAGIRASAIIALRNERGNNLVIGVLEKALKNDPDDWVRFQAAIGLLLEKMNWDANRQIGKYLQSSKIHDVRIAVEALGLIRNVQYIPILLHKLRSPDYSLRCDAAEALGLMGYDSVLPSSPVLPSLNIAWARDKSPSVRASAAFAIANITGNQKALRYLPSAPEKSVWVLPSYVVELLGKLRHGRGVKYLIPYLQHKTPYVRRQAGRALRRATGKRFGNCHAPWREWYETEWKPKHGEGK